MRVRFSILAAAILLAGCDLSFNIGSLLPTPFQGTYASLAVNAYSCVNGGFFFNNLTQSLNAQKQFNLGMANNGWSSTVSIQDSSVSSASVTNAYPNSDLLFFSGHGIPGAIIFTSADCPNVQATLAGWGPGPIGGSNVFIDGPTSFPGPVTGRLKWMVLDSSTTVAGPSLDEPSGVPNEEFDSVWAGAFGGSLHGIYGYWMGPGTCGTAGSNPFPGRVCDIVDDPDQEVGTASSFTGNAFGGANVHDAWVQAALDNQRDGQWSIWEDPNNRNDSLLSATNPAPNGAFQYFYWAGNPNPVSPNAPIAISATTFTVSPFTLTHEAIADSTEISQASSLLGGLSSQVDTGTQVTISKNSARAVHYYGTSGALTVHGVSLPYNITEQAAQSAATSFLTASLGIPSDAVLTTTLSFNQSDVTTGSIIPTDWEFIWRSTTGLVAGKAIKVVVDAQQNASTVCNKFETVIVGLRQETICVSSTTTFTYTPNVVYHYRNWPSMSSRRTILSNGQPATSPASIDALTASASLPPGVAASVTAYSPGWWCDGIYTSSSTDGAIPAWIFDAGNSYYGVDAVTGQLLGSAPL